MIREITQSTVVHEDDGYGGSTTDYIVCEVEADASDDEIAEAVRDCYPASRCHHEHDCCGNYYASGAHWAFAGNVGYGDDSPRLILITQGWSQNV